MQYSQCRIGRAYIADGKEIAEPPGCDIKGAKHSIGER